jgi:replicative DNA helicase
MKQDDAERAVLGSMLRDNGTIHDVVLKLGADYFRTAPHRMLFAAIVALYDAGKPVDTVTLAELLKDRRQVEDVGGYAYLGELLDAAPTAANVGHYAGIVHDRAIRRLLFEAAREIAARTKDGAAPPEQLLEDAERRIFSVAQIGTEAQTLTARELVGQAYDRYDACAQKGGLGRGLLTGFVDLDQLTAGLQDSEVTIIAARTSVGKTMLALALARHTLRDGHPVCFASLEQSGVELIERLACCEAGLDSQRLRCGTLGPEERRRFHEAGDRLGRLPLFVDEAPAQTMTRIAATARRLKLQKGIRLLIVDYLQLVAPEDRRAPRHEQVSQTSRRLKFLAKELDIPVVALAQLNRAVEDRQGQEPRLSDLRESGSIEQDADMVLLLHRPPDEPGVVVVNIAKQRNGPTDRVRLAFNPERQRFDNYAAGIP